MRIGFWDLVSFHNCPQSYHLSHHSFPFKLLRVWRDRKDDFRRAVEVYHDPANAENPQYAAVMYFYNRHDALEDRLYLQEYERLFHLLPRYCRLVPANPWGIDTSRHVVRLNIGRHNVSLTLDYTAPLPGGLQEAWIVRFSDVAPEEDEWGRSFAGQAAFSILRHSMPNATSLGICYLKAGVVHKYSLPLEADSLDSGLEQELVSSVAALSCAKEFRKSPGGHCRSCFHYVNRRCRGALAS